MGWWKVQGTENTIGDGPLDALGGAVVAVVEEYQAAFNRRPTTEEWGALLTAVLGGEGADRALDRGMVKRVHVERAE